MTQAIERPGADAPEVNGPHRRHKPWFMDFFSTAVGKKWVMAVSGVAILGFVLAHAFGNIKMYFGPVQFDHYAEALRTLLYPYVPKTWVLWAMRIGLIVAFAAHIGSAISLTRMNQRSRPTKYQSPRHYIAANFASRSMRWTGIIIALFLAWHLADLTWGWVEPRLRSRQRLRQRCGQLRAGPGRAAVHRRQHRSRHPPVPRHLVDVPVHGAEQPPLQRIPPTDSRRGRRRHHGGQRLVPDRSPHRHRRLSQEKHNVALTLDSNVPPGPLADKWDNHKFDLKLVEPNNRRKFEVIVVGTGLAGAAAAATLGELGYNVKVFTYHDSPRRAHSIAAQGGINAAKNYRNDGDSVFRLFYDTIKGGDYRSREANVYRLAQVSVNIIDQCAAQGVPFAREYGGLLDNRSFGGAQVARTFYARGQTGQQLLLGAYQALARQIHLGTVTLLQPHRDAGRGAARRPGRGHHRPRSAHRRGQRRTPATPCCWPPAATATSTSCRPTPRPAT